MEQEPQLAEDEASQTHFQDLLELTKRARRHSPDPLPPGPAIRLRALVLFARVSCIGLTPIYLLVCFRILLPLAKKGDLPSSLLFLAGAGLMLCQFVATLRTWATLALTPTLDHAERRLGGFRFLVLLPRRLFRVAAFFSPSLIGWIPAHLSEREKGLRQRVTGEFAAKKDACIQPEIHRTPRLTALLAAVASATDTEPWERLNIGFSDRYRSSWTPKNGHLLELPKHDLQALSPRELLVFLLTESWHKQDPAMGRLRATSGLVETLEFQLRQLQVMGRSRFFDVYYLQVSLFNKLASTLANKAEQDYEVAALRETARVLGSDVTIRFCRKNHGAELWAQAPEARELQWLKNYTPTALAMTAQGPPAELSLDILDSFEPGNSHGYLGELFLDLQQNGRPNSIPKPPAVERFALDVIFGDRGLILKQWSDEIRAKIKAARPTPKSLGPPRNGQPKLKSRVLFQPRK